MTLQIDTWLLKAIATSVSAELQTQYGKELFYSPEEVFSACKTRNLADRLYPYAMSMFVAPEHAEKALNDFGISDPSGDLRKMMAQKLPYSDISGLECFGNPPFNFHDAGSHHAFDGPSTSGDSGGDGGGGSGDG